MRVSFSAGLSGKSYFEKFLKSLSISDRAVILAVFDDIQQYGLDAKGCDFRQIEGKLWEIKIKTPTSGYRFFYILISADHMQVLHSYKKQGQKAPQVELNIARKRLKEILNEK